MLVAWPTGSAGVVAAGVVVAGVVVGTVFEVVVPPAAEGFGVGVGVGGGRW